MALVQLLVVDDSSHWRSFVLRYFEAKTEYEIIGVAVSELEAIQKASELPNVILMDINLPGVGGIEATQQICKIYPGSKVIFLSLLNDSAIVDAAFRVGGSGYTLKRDVGQDLPVGIRVILDGGKFVSRSLRRP